MFDTPFAPLGLATGWNQCADYTPFASLRLWIITYQHPPNHDEYHTRIRHDLAECRTRIHSVDFGAEGMRIKSVLYSLPRRGNIFKLTFMVGGER